jgi:antitoxin component YwqK of YwqJK toxin-antitoxin module
MEGLNKIYYDNGQLNIICYYKNGKLDGLLKKYYYNDEKELVLEMIEKYEDGYKHGECKYYDVNGLLEEISNYVYDSLDGDYYKYKEGILKTKCEYYRDEYLGEGLVGEYLEYNNGCLKSIYNYDHDRKDGEFKEFYDNGILKEKGEYSSGNKYGFIYKYDKEGNLTETQFIEEN